MNLDEFLEDRKMYIGLLDENKRGDTPESKAFYEEMCKNKYKGNYQVQEDLNLARRAHNDRVRRARRDRL